MKTFLKNNPLVFALIGIISIVLIVDVLPPLLLPHTDFGALELGIREAVAAVLILLIYFIFAGKRDFRFTPMGFGYGFTLMRYLFIIYFVIASISMIRIIMAIADPEMTKSTLLSLANAALIGLTVGIVEEFSFRAMIFGGLASAFGHTKKGVVWAAVVSGILFGFIHVAMDVVTGNIQDIWGWLQVLGKTVQAGLVGFVLAIIYFKTRNIWVVVILHGLNDFLLFLMEVVEGIKADGYVFSDQSTLSVPTGLIPALVYAAFSLLTIPMIIRCVRELGKEKDFVLPMDDGFVPRPIRYSKKKADDSAKV